MSAREVTDPSQHGWIDLGNGKWGWAGEGSGEPPVTSVNTKIGDVVLNASDVGALPDTYTPPAPPAAPVDSVNGKTGAVSLTAADVGAKPSSYKAPVDSVNGKTGAVTLNAADVGASTFSGSYNDLNNKPTIPTNNNQLTNGAGYITAADIPSGGYDGSDAVKLTGNQSINGRKEFQSYGSSAAGIFLRTPGSLHSRIICGSDISGEHWMALEHVASTGSSNGPINLGFGSTKGVKNIYMNGSIYGQTFRGAGAEVDALKVRGSFVLTIDDVMDAFKTLRDATKDEETIEGMRVAISDSIGGLLQKLEAMKSDLENHFPEHSGIPADEGEPVNYDEEEGAIIQ